MAWLLFQKELTPEVIITQFGWKAKGLFVWWALVSKS